MGMNGWLAGEYIAAGLDQAAAGHRALSDARTYAGVVDKMLAMQKALTNIEDRNAANLAEKHALREALRRLDPKHEMLTNVSLQDRIRAAGLKAFTITENFDAAREAGSSFKY